MKRLRLITTFALLLVLMTPGVFRAEPETTPAPEAKKEKETKAKPKPEAKPAPKVEPESEPELDYWLTVDNLGVRRRHNSKCRFYHSDKGRPCSKSEGRPCKTCGG